MTFAFRKFDDFADAYFYYTGMQLNRPRPPKPPEHGQVQTVREVPSTAKPAIVLAVRP
jgi:hypothetical protein